MALRRKAMFQLKLCRTRMSLGFISLLQTENFLGQIIFGFLIACFRKGPKHLNSHRTKLQLSSLILLVFIQLFIFTAVLTSELAMIFLAQLLSRPILFFSYSQSCKLFTLGKSQ